MSHLSPHLAPGGGGSTVGKFNQVKSILNIVAQFTDWHMAMLAIILVLTCQSHVHHRQGLCSHVFSKQEELIEAHAIGLEVIREEPMCEGVVPAILVQRAVFYRTYRFLPIVACFQVGSLNDATTGESKQSGVQFVESFYQITSQAVLPAHPCVGGEEREMFEVEWSLRGEEYSQHRFGFLFWGGKDHLIFLPLRRADRQFFPFKRLIVAAHQFDADLLFRLLAAVAGPY